MMHPLDYRKPSSDEVGQMRLISEALKVAYDTILEQSVRSAEQTLALRKVQEARMWANTGIILNPQ